MPTLPADMVRNLAVRILQAAGVADEEARIVADLMVDSNLAGHDSHGILRLPQYMGMLRDGSIVPGAVPRTVRETPSTAVLDGGWGFGAVTAQCAMKMAVRKARACVVGSVAVRRCNHIGRLGAYVDLACREGMVGILMVNGHSGDQGVAPFGGVARRLGTNPIAVALPSGGEAPVALDITTSVAAGKLRLHRARGESIPEGWLIDAGGRPSTDPNTYYDDPRGSLLPLGGHKGYGLSVLIDLLVGTLSGSGPSASDSPRSGNALLAVALDIGRFTPLEVFREEVRRFIAYLKTSPKAPGVAEILAPGERACRERARRLREGIEVEGRTWTQILEIARSLGLSPCQDAPRPKRKPSSC